MKMKKLMSAFLAILVLFSGTRPVVFADDPEKIIAKIRQSQEMSPEELQRLVMRIQQLDKEELQELIFLVRTKVLAATEDVPAQIAEDTELMLKTPGKTLKALLPPAAGSVLGCVIAQSIPGGDTLFWEAVGTAAGGTTGAIIGNAWVKANKKIITTTAAATAGVVMVNPLMNYVRERTNSLCTAGAAGTVSVVIFYCNCMAYFSLLLLKL